MFHEKSRLAFTIGSGLILAFIVGCASHMNSDVNASLRPLPSRPPGRPSPLMRAEQSPTTANAGTGTLPSTQLTRGAVSTETLSTPTRTAPQSQAAAPSELPPAARHRQPRNLGRCQHWVDSQPCCRHPRQDFQSVCHLAP